MNDYSINFDEEEYADDHERTVNVKGRYNRDNFAANRQFSSVEKTKNALNSGIQLWDVPCIRETYAEDNDTEEDEAKLKMELEDYLQLKVALCLIKLIIKVVT